ncbi:Short-chain dehydrogenase/reductase family 9C member 7 [Seminavis robusta]|uniref:Short-chain dehydrogenase/reductase family 9C member 7 n=1 Tax=Seminavis robusta TaxID=568900 RepID=A0A9N8EBZ3_9STRA|nr:Short-chain dehydrogenase/reductase family 9C member 7 [Seminavis robusta]|eukprot:Sro868_g213280.1 Short-chain dehydrogenase/reductase family 9C member 7 (1526) ;mRNA; r:12691-17430
MAEESTPKSPQKAQGGAKAGRSKSPGPRRNQQGKGKGKSKSPGPRRNQGKSKSPVRQNKGKSKSPTRPKKQQQQQQQPKETPVEAPPRANEFVVDGLALPMSSYTSYRSVSTLDTMLQATAVPAKPSQSAKQKLPKQTQQPKQLEASSTSNRAEELVVDDLAMPMKSYTVYKSAALEELPEVLQCDPFFGSIAVKSHFMVSSPSTNSTNRGRQAERSNGSDTAATNSKQSNAKNNNSNKKSKSPVPKGNKKGRSKSPKKNQQKQQQQKQAASTPNKKQAARSKSPKRNKGKQQANGKKETNENLPTKTSGMAKFLPHVQVDPCFVGMAAAMCDPLTSTLGMGINLDGRLGVLSLVKPLQPKTQSKPTPPSVEYDPIIPPTYMEVEPLVSQMVPSELADAINLEMSKTLEERAFPDESFMSPAKPTKQNNNGKSARTPAVNNDLTPPTNLAGKVAFFERLMRQSHEQPTVDPTVKVKAAVSEKVRSVHDQVRTSLVTTKKINPNAGWELPQDVTPLAQKRERVETFFEKEADSTVAPVKPSSQRNSNWAKVETAPPSKFEPHPEGDEKDEQAHKEEHTDPSPKVDDLVVAMEKKVSEEKVKDGEKENIKKDEKKQQQQKNKKGKSKSPRRKKSKSPARQKQQKVPAPEPVVAPELEEKEEAAAEPKPAKAQETVPEPATTKSETLPAKDESQAENDGTGKQGNNQKARKGRSRSPREKQSKSKSPVRQEEKKAPISAPVAAEEAKQDNNGAPEPVETKVVPVSAPAPEPEAPKLVEESKATTNGNDEAEAVEKTPEEVKKEKPSNEEAKSSTAKEEEPPSAEVSSDKAETSTEPETAEGEKKVDAKATEAPTVESKAVSTNEVPAESASKDAASDVPEDLKGPKPSPQRSPMPIKASTPYPSYALALAKGKKQAQRKLLFSPAKSGGNGEVGTPEAPRVTSDVDELIARVLGKPTTVKGKERSEKPKNAVPSSASAGSGTRSNETGRAKVEEMAQRLADASPQKKVDDLSSISAETDSEFKKVVTDDEIREKAWELFEQSVQGQAAAVSDAPTVPATTALKKANFNPYDVLDDEPVTPGNEAKKTPKKSKKGKNKSSKPEEVSVTPKQTKKGGKGKTQKASASPKKKGVRFETPSAADKGILDAKVVELQHSPPTLVIPLHMLNTLVHTKPFSYIFDGIFWILALLLGCPVGAIVVLLTAIYRLFGFFLRLFGIGVIKPKKNPEQQLGVVVTGCDSGFGHDLAFSLMKEGFVVFCCCLRKDSLKIFEGEELATPLLMDVTKDNDVDKAAKLVEDWLSGADGRYLHALVNNAGVGAGGLVDWIPVSGFQKHMDVNYFGTIRCCKKFLPLFRFQAASGFYSDARIVNMTSVAGLVSGGMFSVSYEASKHAAEAFTTNLRLETRALGLQVSVVNPTFHRTALTRSMGDNLRKVWKSLPAEKRKEYGEDYLSDACEVSDFASDVICWNSCHVVTAMQQAVSFKKAPVRLLVGMDAKYVFSVIHLLPTWFTSIFNSRKFNIDPPAMMQKSN